MSVRLLERGPVRAIVRVESRYGASTLREDYVLGADAPYVDVRVAIDWHEQLKLLKLRYPTSVDTETATYETPYGHIERPAGGDEEPGQSWVDVSGAGRGLAVANDAKYGYDVRGGDIGISAVRSPVWAWHDPRELEEGGDFEYMDQGRQTFLVRLVPHAGDWRAAGVVRRAAELNQPPFALIETFHEGPLPQRASFADDGGGDVVVTVGEGRRGRRRARRPRVRDRRPARRTARIELLGADDRGRASARTRSRRSSSRATAAPRARPICSSGERSTSWQLKGWLGEEWRWHVDKPWDAPGWLPRACPAASSTTSCARARCPTRTSSGTAARRVGRRSGRGSTARRVTRRDGRVRGRRPRGDGVRRRRGGRRTTSARSRRSASTCRAGEHLLAVAVHAAPESEAQVGRTSRVRVHKSRMGYGWDFCPRLVHQGIWRPVDARSAAGGVPGA